MTPIKDLSKFEDDNKLYKFNLSEGNSNVHVFPNPFRKYRIYTEISNQKVIHLFHIFLIVFRLSIIVSQNKYYIFENLIINLTSEINFSSNFVAEKFTEMLLLIRILKIIINNIIILILLIFIRTKRSNNGILTAENLLKTYFF